MVAFCDLVPRLGLIKASLELHRELLFSILHIPMSFFWVNTRGRILSRFSSDVAVIDHALPRNMIGAKTVLFQVNSHCLTVADYFQR